MEQRLTTTRIALAIMTGEYSKSQKSKNDTDTPAVPKHVRSELYKVLPWSVGWLQTCMSSNLRGFRKS